MQELTPFLGRFARQIIHGLVRIYYPTRFITGAEKIPPTGPVIFVANHSNSLIDPVIIGITAQRPVHFMAKAPLFDVPIFGRVLHALGMIPAYRGVDDRAQVERNMKSLSDCAAYLVRGEAVGLFPEGKSHDALKVDKVRTGAGRIAVQAVADGARELKIVPLGINFEDKERFRSSVWVRVGEPIDVGLMAREFEQAERQLMRTLTSEIDGRLKGAVIHLNEDSWEPLLRDLEVLRPPPEDRAGDPIAWVRQRKRIADAINYFHAADRPRAEAMTDAIRHLRDQVAGAGLTLRAPILRWRGSRLMMHLMGQLVWTAAAFPLALAGVVHHIVPFALNRLLTARVQAPGRATVALTRLLLGLPIYGLWYGLVWWFLKSQISPAFALGWTLGAPFAGVFALAYCRRLGTTLRLLWMQFKVMMWRSSQLFRLRHEQLQVSRKLAEMAAEFEVVEPSTPVGYR